MTVFLEQLRACDCGIHCKSGCIQEMAADEIERLNAAWLADAARMVKMSDEYEAALEEIERLRTECEAWRECALYDPKMEGPAFKGWDRSALDRCRTRYIEMKS